MVGRVDCVKGEIANKRYVATFIVACGLIWGVAFPGVAGVGAFSAFGGGVDARALGMGGAFTPIADNYAAPYWNPAGVAYVEGLHIGGMYSSGPVLNSNFMFLSSMGSIKILGVRMGAAGSDIRFTMPNLTQNGVMGTLAFGLDNQLFGAFGGLNIKYYSQTFLGASSSGTGFDMGILGHLFHTVWFGGTISNIGGTAVGLDEVGQITRIGAAMKLFNETLLAAAVFEKEYNWNSWHFGVDFNTSTFLRMLPPIAIRAGWVLSDGESLPSLGLGLSVWNVNLNFAVVTAFGELFSLRVLSVEVTL